MIHEDLGAVLELEHRCFTDPWAPETFETEIEDRDGIRWTRVAMRGPRLAGYVIAWFILDEAHIANLAVVPVYRFLGLGTHLVKLVIKEAGRRGAGWIALEVRVSNDAALALYRKLGFRPAGLRKGYYGDNREDAIVMTLRLGVGSGGEAVR